MSDRISCWIFVTFALVGASVAILNRHLFSILVGTVDLVTFGYFAWRQYQCKLVLTRDGVLAVRATKSAVRLSWSQIDHFAYRGGLRASVGAWIVPNRWVELQSYGRVFGTDARSAVATLEDCRHRSTTDGQEGPGF